MSMMTIDCEIGFGFIELKFVIRKYSIVKLIKNP